MTDDYPVRLREALAIANVPTLLLVLIQLTGDDKWLEPPFRPTRAGGLDDNDTGGLPEDVQREIREAAFDAIVRWRAGSPVAIPKPGPELLIQMMTMAMGEPVAAEYATMTAASLGAEPVMDTSGLAGAEHPSLDVVVVGGGVSGICAAVALKKTGISFTVVEKSAAVGGVWNENHYPGVGVDTPSHLYSFSFSKYDWSRYFAQGSEVQAYLEHVVEEFDLAGHFLLGTEAVRAVFDEEAQQWGVTLRLPDGSTVERRARMMISAAGIYNPPKFPDVPGINSFLGQAFHTARWLEGIDLTDKDVCIIGNGATAMQIVPAVADTVRSLTIFQRSRHWIVPFEKFSRPVPEALRWLFREFPLYEAWYRVRLGWTFNDKTYPALQKDPAWPHLDRSLNAISEGYRRAFVRYIEAELGDRRDLLPSVIPPYPPFGKRLLLDNGWYKALTKSNVRLVEDPVVEITQSGARTAAQEYEADVLVLATGFDVIHFLNAYEIVGRNGITIQETWEDNARAYLGTTAPGFPNMFVLYGPNLQPGHGGSIMFTIERQMNYILSLLRQVEEAGAGVVECRVDVCASYNERVDETHEKMVWTHPGMRTYYRNSRGRVVVNTPFRNVDFFSDTISANLDDYILEALKS